MRLVRSSRGVITLATALTLALAAAGNAHADTRRISDANDRPGRLDIRSASHGHSGARVAHTISTFGRWPGRLLGPNTPNLFAVEISTDGDRGLERVVLVFLQNGRMVAGVFRVRSRRLVFVGSASASKPTARSVRVSIRRSRLGTPAGYRWNAYSQFGSTASGCNLCIDRAPNSRRVLHDITDPTIRLRSFPPIPPDVEYDVSFRVSDAGGAGLRRWQLQHRLLGDPTWTTVEGGRTGGLKSHHHVAEEDDDDQFRVVAVDRHGNRRVSPARLVSVPIDDRSTRLVYTPPWTQEPGDTRDFRDTLTSSMNPTDMMEFEFTGRYVAWVAPGNVVGEASVTIDGTPPEAVTLGGSSGRRAIVFEKRLANGDHTITISVASGTVSVDGIVVR